MIENVGAKPPINPVVQSGPDKGRIRNVLLALEMAENENATYDKNRDLEKEALQKHEIDLTERTIDRSARKLALATQVDTLPSVDSLVDHVQSIEKQVAKNSGLDRDANIKKSLRAIAEEKARQQLRLKDSTKEPDKEQLERLTSSYEQLLTVLLETNGIQLKTESTYTFNVKGNEIQGIPRIPKELPEPKKLELLSEQLSIYYNIPPEELTQAAKQLLAKMEASDQDPKIVILGQLVNYPLKPEYKWADISTA